MSKIIMRLHLQESKTRKRAVRPMQKHRDKTKYTRKYKHKAAESGGFVLVHRWSAQPQVTLATAHMRCMPLEYAV